ncbi:hypothetical protein COOONC_04085 [Cooperia oncophora]
MVPGDFEADDVISLRKLTTDQLIERLLHLKSIHEKDAKDFEEYKASSLEMETIMEREIEDAQREAKAATAKLHLLTVEAERAHSKNEAEKREFLKIEEALRREVSSCFFRSAFAFMRSHCVLSRLSNELVSLNM